MKRLVVVFAALVLLVGALAVPVSAASNEERTVVDMRGNEIELPSEVEKYGILYSSAVPMCGLLDEGMAHVCLCPTLYADWTFELYPDLESHTTIVDKNSVTAEQILETGAQVIFWSASSHEELVESLEAVGVACVNVGVSNADDLLAALHIIADTLDTEYAHSQLEKYEQKLSEYQEYAQEHAAQIPEEERLSTLVIGDIDDTTSFGESAYEPYWASLVGLDYILPSDDGAAKVTLTMEQIYEFDPDVIVVEGFFDENALSEDPAWSGLRAVQTGMVVSNPSVLDTWSKPGAETLLQYVWALDKFYPQYAGDISVQEEVTEFYEEFYGYKMDPKNVEEMLQGHRIIFE